jgi:hypothetical protein
MSQSAPAPTAVVTMDIATAVAMNYEIAVSALLVLALAAPALAAESDDATTTRKVSGNEMLPHCRVWCLHNRARYQNAVVSRSSPLPGKPVELPMPGLHFITAHIVPARGRFTAAPFVSNFDTRESRRRG